MKQQGTKVKNPGLGIKAKAIVPQLGNRSTRRSKRKDSEEECTLPQIIPQNQFQQIVTKQSFQSQITRFIIQIPLALFLDEHFDIKQITRAQSMPLQIRVTRQIDNIICFLKLPEDQSISQGKQFSLTLHGKYSWFNGSSVVNKPIKSVRKTITKQNWEQASRLKLVNPVHSDFFLILTLRAEEQLYLDYPGLVNQGNTCYLNSYLQMFFHLPQFRRLIFLAQTKEADKFPATLQMLFYKMLNQERAVSPEELIKSFGWSKKDTQVQQDVQQFSCLFFDILERKVFVDRSPGRIQSVPELFCGELTNYIQCLHVEFRAENIERFYDLSIPMAPTLKQALDIFFSETILDDNNCYKTDHYGLQQARKGLCLSKMPPVLMLQLKRFQYNYIKDTNQKLLQECKYPEELDFGQWTLDPQNSLPYVLYAVLVHEGSSASSGHYYVLIKIEDEWFRFNDQRVQRASRERALQYNYGGFSTSIEYDHKQMKVVIRNQILNATAYMLVYVNKDLYPLLFQEGEAQFPQWLIDQTKYRQELEVQKKIRKQSICDIPVISWSNYFKGQEVQSIGIYPKDRDEIAQKIDTIPKSQKVQEWLQELYKHNETQDKYVYIFWSVQERQVLINANCRSNQSVKQLFNEVQDALIIFAPMEITKEEYFIFIKLFNQKQETSFINYGLSKLKKDCHWKDLHQLMSSLFPGETFNHYYMQDKKTGLIKIGPADTRMVPQTTPARNQLLVVVVEQLKEGEIGGEVEKWYKTEMDNLEITFKNQVDKEYSWERQIDKNQPVKKIRQIIFEQILKENLEYQSARNIVIKYKSKKNSKLLTQAKDNEKLKQIIKCDKVLFFSYSSLSINERLTQKELVLYLRSALSKKLSEPQTIIVDKSKQESLMQMISGSPVVRLNLPERLNYSYRMFLLAKDRAYVNDIVDETGYVSGKGELLSILQREKNTALVVQQYEKVQVQNKVQPINVLIHHVTKTGQRFGNPMWEYTYQQTLLSALKYQVLDSISVDIIDFEGKTYQINPMKVRLLAYVKQWSKAEELPEPLEIQGGETQVPDESIGAKFGHPRYLRIGIVHNSISKSVQRMNLNVQ